MKYGLYVPPFGEYADARMLANLARDAEEAGWDMKSPWPVEAMRERILQGPPVL